MAPAAADPRRGRQTGGLKQRRFFAPVLDTFVRALPYTFRDVPTPDRTALEVSITGESGGQWCLVREAGAWELFLGPVPASTASVVLDQEDVSRLFTWGLGADEARRRAQIRGDERLGASVFDMVSVIA